MDNLEKKLDKNCFTNIDNYTLKRFKKNNPELYRTVMQTLHEVNLKNVKDNYLVLLKPNITKVSLKVNKQKTFIFCGVFKRGKKDVVLLELSETIGTFFFEETKIVKQLRNYKIGLKLRLEKTSEGFNLAFPYEEVNEGLFEEN